MKKPAVCASLLILCVAALKIPAAPAQDAARALLGSWSGKATAPDGGPPSGLIQVSFVKGEDGGLKGKLLVKGEGGLQYSGEVSDIAFKKRVLTARVTFKLGENPLEVDVSGPLKGRTISGEFSVSTKGEKIGEGTFSITRDPPGAGATPKPPAEKNP